MFCALKIHLPFEGGHDSRRRRHRFTPSIGESASHLETRALLSAAAGGAAHAAVAHHATVEARHDARMAHHHAAVEGRHIRHEVQVVRHDARMEARHPSAGRSAALARTEASLLAAIATDPVVSVSPTGMISVVGPTGAIIGGIPGAVGTTTSGGFTNPGSILGTTTTASTIVPGSTIGSINPSLLTGALGPAAGLNNSIIGSFGSSLPTALISGTGTPSIAPSVSQVPIGTFFAAPSALGTGFSVTTGNNTTTISNVTPNVTTGTLSQSNFLPFATTSGLAFSPLGSLFTTGMVPTAGLGTTGTTGVSPVSSLTFTPTAFLSGASLTGTYNPSPVPLNGVLPFTGTPANPSPISFTGTLI